MTGEEPQRRPERFSAIVDAALAAWAARWPLYVGLAALSVAVELGAGALARFDPIVLFFLVPIVDAFPTAFVTIDIASRATGEPRERGALLRASLARWPVLAVVLVLVAFVEALIFPAVFGSADQTLYGLLILPAIAVLGVLGLPSVIAAIDGSLPLFALPGYAILRAFVMAGAWPNLGRLTLGGAMLAVPLMLQELLERTLTARGMPEGIALFWSGVPVDALTLAPFQAFFTLLYIDLLLREARRSRS